MRGWGGVTLQFSVYIGGVDFWGIRIFNFHIFPEISTFLGVCAFCGYFWGCTSNFGYFYRLFETKFDNFMKIYQNYFGCAGNTGILGVVLRQTRYF